MTHSEQHILTPRTYRVVIEGTLEGHLASWFDGFCIHEADQSTVLTGPVRDQSELQGLLRRIHDLHLTLRSVETLD